jgi:murein DD-endopeptidase MepM/ murein hydrolase activator NlpD
MAELRWPLLFNRIRDGNKNNSFGWVRTNNDGTRRPHQGWDLQTPRGMHCYAVADGVVLDVNTIATDKGYGEDVTLKFEEPVGLARYAFYAHLSQIFVQKGQRVSAGDPIGRVGVTGNAVHVSRSDSLSLMALPKKEDHLHFELRTVAQAGGGLHGRLDPKNVYGVCPLSSSVVQLRG